MDDLKTKMEPEVKGVHGGEGKDIQSKSDASCFDLHGKGYVGPENWTPTNKGEKTPGK
jgi:hypothetical protein